MIDKKAFYQSARTAIREGKSAQLAVARAQANQFVDGDAQFNPRTVQRLGTTGLSTFLHTVRERRAAVSVLPAPEYNTYDPDDSPTTVSSSSHQSELYQWLRAVGYGVFAGLMVLTSVAFGFLLRLFILLFFS